MGKDRVAEARAAESRKLAAKMEKLGKEVEGINYREEDILEALKEASEVRPELAGLYEAVQLDPTAFEQIKTDPRLDEIMKGNLDTLQEMAEESGFSEEDLAKRRELQREVAANEQARQKSIAQEAMMKGQGGSGVEAAARLLSSQQSAQRAAEASDRLAMDSASAKKAALQNASNLASSMQGQQYDQQANLAGARDRRSMLNAQSQQLAQDKNLALRQAMANQLADQRRNYLANRANVYEKAGQFDLNKLQAKAGFQQNASNAMMNSYQAKPSKWGQIGTVVGGAVGSYFGPAGTAAGASLGGAVGNMAGGTSSYNDGGIKKGALGNLANRRDPLPSPKQDTSLSAAQQIAQFNNLQRGNNKFNEGGVKEKKQEVSKNDTAETIRAIAELLQSVKQPEGNKFAEGGVRNSYYNGSDINNGINPNYFNNTPAYDPNQNPEARKALMAIRNQQSGNNPMYNPTYRGKDTTSNSFNSLAPSSPKSEELSKSQLNDVFGDMSKPMSSEDAKVFKEMGVEKVGFTEKDAKPIDDVIGDKNNTGETLQAISSIVGQLGKNSRPAQQPQAKMVDINIPQMQLSNFRAEEGGVKPNVDSMRDMLLGEVRGFAEGGVKCCSQEDDNNLQELLKLELNKFEEGGVQDYSDDRLVNLHNQRNKLLSQMRENEELGNLRANKQIQQQLAPIEKEMITNAEKGLYADGGITPELEAAATMLRTNNQPAPNAPMPGGQPPMPAPVAPQMAPMPPQGMPVAPMPQQAPMPPQGQMMADGGMAYEDGGEGTIIDSGMEMYAGDQLPDRINDGEMVLNVEQQDRLNDALMELKRLKSKERTDKMLHDGTADINPMQQESIMAFVRGEIDVDELPNDRVVKEPSVGEPTGGMAQLLDMVSKRKRR